MFIYFCNYELSTFQGLILGSGWERDTLNQFFIIFFFREKVNFYVKMMVNLLPKRVNHLEHVW